MSAPNCTGFVWTKRREAAALLVAEDDLPDTAIAERAGISKRQLENWKRHPDFAARVQANVDRLRERALQRGIAQKDKRVAALHDRWQRMQQVITARAADPEHAETPGWQTGLLVRQVKGVGGGDDFQLVDQFAVDTGLLRELRAHEEQAAKELGQWVEKVAPTDAEGKTLSFVDLARQLLASPTEDAE